MARPTRGRKIGDEWTAEDEAKSRGQGRVRTSQASINLFDTCKLEGRELDREVWRLMGAAELFRDSPPPYSSNWNFGGPLLESNQVFIDPPHSVHVNFGYDPVRGGCDGEYRSFPLWRATVSASVRTYPNKNFPHIGNVGRGSGESLLVAAMRAIVDSFGPQTPEK